MLPRRPGTQNARCPARGAAPTATSGIKTGGCGSTAALTSIVSPRLRTDCDGGVCWARDRRNSQPHRGAGCRHNTARVLTRLASRPRVARGSAPDSDRGSVSDEVMRRGVCHGHGGHVAGRGTGCPAGSSLSGGTKCTNRFGPARGPTVDQSPRPSCPRPGHRRCDRIVPSPLAVTNRLHDDELLVLPCRGLNRLGIQRLAILGRCVVLERESA